MLNIHSVSQDLGSTLFFFVIFSGTGAHTEELLTFSTALEICYIIATRILKFNLEIAEIIEVKATH